MKKSILNIFIPALLWGCSGFLDEVDKDLLVPTTTEHYAAVLLHEFSSDRAPYFEQVDFMGDNVEEYPYSNVTEEKRKDYKPVYTWQMEIELDYNGKRISNNGAWKDAYRSISVANYILELIDGAIGTQEERDFIKGEAYFVRSWCYFLLANLYGMPYQAEKAHQELGVPLRLDNGLEQVYSRASLAETYEQVIADLTLARSLIQQSGVTKSKYHPSVEACDLLFSRIYLYMNDWEKAEKAATEVIKEHPVLVGFDPNRAFVTPDCDDILYTLQMMSSSDTKKYDEYGWRVSNDFMGLFSANDTRLKVFFSKIDGKQGLVYYPNKRERKFTEMGRVNLRVAEAYLNRAEARYHLGKDARSDIQALVNRRYTSPEAVVIPQVGPGLLHFILEERRKELCFEDHHRWFDLRRMKDRPEIVHLFTLTDGDGNKTGREKYTLLPDDLNYTLPIPLEERDNNPLIYNNERYEKLPETETEI